MENIGKYKILGKLGQGGMGMVYKALDPALERTVALKTISGNLDSEPDLRARFFREGRSAASLSHKNIITVYDLGEDNGMAYMAMEFLDGEDLRTKIADGKLASLGERLVVMIELCEGLAHAHGRKVIHRDIKPANVFITASGEVKILDFGLARMHTSELTRTGVSMGSPNYMSPEQVRGEKVDQRADIFSAGALLYELLTSRKPFDADSVPATIYKVLQEDPEPVERLDSSIHPKLAEIVKKALEKDLDARYQDVESLLDDLKEFCAQLPGFSSARERIGRQPAESGPAGNATVRDLARLGATLVEVPAGADSSWKGKTGPDLPVAASRGRFRPLHYAAAATFLLVVAASTAYWTMTGRLPGSRAREAENTSGDPTPSPSKIADSAPGAGRSEALSPSAQGASGDPPPADRESRSDASPQPAGGTRAAPGAPPANAAVTAALLPPNAKVGMVAAGIERAKSLIGQGKYAEATARLGEVLSVSPRDAEALRLTAQLNAYSQKSAADALNEMMQSKLKAEAAAAARYAPSAFEAAQNLEQEARKLRDDKRYGEATVKLSSASGLYLTAALESEAGKAEEEKRARLHERERALNLQRQQAESSRAAPEPERLSAAKADAEARARESSRSANAHAETVANTTTPSGPAPASADVIRGAISSILQQYITSMQSKDIQRLREIWPGLGGQQEKALQEQFSAARKIDVQFGEVDLKVAGDTATVTTRRSLSMLTVDGQRLHSEVRAIVYLKLGARSWLIDRIRFEPLR